MGRIFEARKHTMFARWDRMAKQFARIGKEITIAVKAGGPDPARQPLAAAGDPERARRQHAEGQGRGGDQARLRQGRRRATRRSSTRATRRTASRCWSRPPPTTRRARSPTCAPHFNKGGGNLANSGSVGFQFKRMGVFRLKPEGIDQEALELDLIDHGLEEMGESDRREGRAAARAPLRLRRLRPAAEGARGARHHAASRPSPSTCRRRRSSCPRTTPRKSSSWSTARAGRRRAEGLPQPRVARSSPLPGSARGSRFEEPTRRSPSTGSGIKP